MNNVMLTKNGNRIKRDRNNLGNYGGWGSLMDELFSDDLQVVKNKDFNKSLSNPKVNIKESDEAYVLDMAVPGFKKSDFQIGLENEKLSISAEIKVEEGKQEENFTRKEFSYASFKRTFILPETVDESAINANYNNGILTVSIPKKEEAKPKPARTIEIS
jgi:HSP20 family protein